MARVATNPARTARPPLARRSAAEFLGSAMLAAVVIGSGIAARQLSPDDVGLQLLENAAATAAGLYAIILIFGPVSGGHFNPVVSLVDAALGGIGRRDVLAYLPVAGRRLHRRRDPRQRHVRAGRDLDLNPSSGQSSTSPVRSGRHARAASDDLRPRPHQTQPRNPRGGRRLHRLGLLLHQLGELRQSRDHGRTRLLKYLRGDRSRLGPGVHRCPGRRAPAWRCSRYALCTRASRQPRRRRSCFRTPTTRTDRSLAQAK